VEVDEQVYGKIGEGGLSLGLNFNPQTQTLKNGFKLS
jgi:hypothetical protein